MMTYPTYPSHTQAIAYLLEAKYAGVETTEFLHDAERIRAGEPWEYVLGWADFLGVRIDLADRPMVPRYETGFWVARAIEDLQQHERPLRVADLFAGSGNVGSAVLKHVPNATIEFHERDALLFPGIVRTLSANGIDASRATMVPADALSGLTGKYDALLAVPPYVAYDALPDLDPEQRDYEPHLAFFAEENGTAFQRQLIERAQEFLAPGGTVYMESDMGQEDYLTELARKNSWTHIERRPDPYGAMPNFVLRA